MHQTPVFMPIFYSVYDTPPYKPFQGYNFPAHSSHTSLFSWGSTHLCVYSSELAAYCFFPQLFPTVGFPIRGELPWLSISQVPLSLHHFPLTALLKTLASLLPTDTRLSGPAQGTSILYNCCTDCWINWILQYNKPKGSLKLVLL